MNTISEALAKPIAGSAGYLLFMTEDLKGDDYLHRPCDKANCAAWTLGHLILSCRSMMTRLGATDLPELPEGFEKAYARDETAPAANEYPYIDRLMPLFKQYHDRLAEFVSGLSPTQINQKLDKPHPLQHAGRACRLRPRSHRHARWADQHHSPQPRPPTAGVKRPKGLQRTTHQGTLEESPEPITCPRQARQQLTARPFCHRHRPFHRWSPATTFLVTNSNVAGTRCRISSTPNSWMGWFT